MTTFQLCLVLGVQLALAGGLAYLMMRQQAQRGALPPEWPQRLAELEAALTVALTKVHADLTARVTSVKGELQIELGDRLQNGLRSIQDTIGKQWLDGRTEQNQRLADTVKVLEQKFDDLRASTERRLDALSERQAASQREARQELQQSLKEGAETMQARLQSLESRTAQTLEAIRGRVDERLKEVSDQVQQKLEKNIQEGFAHFQKVQEHLKAAEEQLRNVGTVGQSINELNLLLKLPHLRGKFGEAMLGNLLGDFLPASSFAEQVVIVPGSKEMVDAVVRFPSHLLPIDSKFNREQVLPLFETSDPQALGAARVQLAQVIKQQARAIQEKYIHPEHGTTDLALMFLPSETIYFEVIRDAELCEALHRCNVFPVSPNTLAITLRAIAMSISQFEFTQGVQKTLEQVRAAQHSFAQFQNRFEDVGKGLEKAQAAYSKASGHLSRYSNRVVRLTGEGVPEVEDAAGEPSDS